MRAVQIPKNRNPLYPVLTYKQFYGASSVAADPLAEIARYHFEDILVALIMICNDVEGRVNNSIDVNATIAARLPPAKSARFLQFVNRQEGAKFWLTNGTVIARIVTDLFGLLPQEGTLLPTTGTGFEEALLDVVLIYNERQYAEIGVGGKVNTHEMLWQLMLMQDITGLNNIHYVRTANAKHVVFIQFLKVALGVAFKEMEGDFKQRTGLDGLYQPAVTLVTLFAHIEDKFRMPGNALVLIERNESIYGFLKNFGMLFSKQTAAGRKGQIGFYITHPFFDHPDGRIYLVDHAHFAFAVDRGYLYYLFKHSKLGALLKGVKSFEDFLAYLGKHYYEQYLVAGLIKTLDRKGFRVIGTDDRGLPDLTLVLNEKDVFFIETKSNALHSSVIDRMDVTGMKEFMDENFAGEKKGAGQLARYIRHYGDAGGAALQIREPKKKLTIYPVIIYTEQHLEKYAFGDYVAEKFEGMIADFAHPFKEIKPLVMIHYDFFVENISLLQQRPILLKSAINRYLAYVKDKKAIFKRTDHNMDHLKAMVSFDKYLVNYPYEQLYQLDQKVIFQQMRRVFGLKDEGG